MNSLISSIASPFEGIFPIPELGIFAILLFTGMITVILNIWTDEKS